MARPPAEPCTSYSHPATATLPLAGHDRICAAAHAASGAKSAGGGPVPPASRRQAVVHMRAGGNTAAVGAPTPPLAWVNPVTRPGEPAGTRAKVRIAAAQPLERARAT